MIILRVLGRFDKIIRITSLDFQVYQVALLSKTIVAKYKRFESQKIINII